MSQMQCYARSWSLLFQFKNVSVHQVCCQDWMSACDSVSVWTFGGNSVNGLTFRYMRTLVPPQEALPSLSVKALHRSTMACKATTGVRVDDFHPRVSLDLSDECCGRVLILLREIQMAGVWPIDAGTTLFLSPFQTASPANKQLLYYQHS